jgi:hypothetical protein
VETRADRLVHCIVERSGLSTTKGHVGNGALVVGPTGSSVLLLSSFILLDSFGSSPRYPTNDVGHGTTAVGAQYFDGDKVGVLANTVLARIDRPSTVSAVAVSVLIRVILWDGFAPRCTKLKFDVVDVDASVDNVDVDTSASYIVIYVLVNGG